MLYRKFLCERCRKCLCIAAELVRPVVRCKRCGATFRLCSNKLSDLRWGKPHTMTLFGSRN